MASSDGGGGGGGSGSSNGDGETLFSLPLQGNDLAYFLRCIAALTPLSHEDYKAGPSAIVLTAVRSSYVLYGGDVYWLSEFIPGLLVVRFGRDGRMAIAGIKNARGDDSDADDAQYSLIFTPWDAGLERDLEGWTAMAPAARAAYDAVMAQVNFVQAAANAESAAREAAGDKSYLEKRIAHATALAGPGVEV